jgi:Icc-related predicted phosphoesterase
VRIVCISDTHDRHARISVPDGDVLVHAGDITVDGETAAIFDAFAWLSRLPHERIVFVPGNHDFGFARIAQLTATLAAKFPRVEVLLDRETTIGTWRVFGSPWQPWFHNWAFNFAPGPAGERQAEERWDAIVDDTEILITHGPVRGILDRTVRGEHVGCPVLRKRIGKLARLKLHVCGHIHEGYGAATVDDVLYVNASSCDAAYRPIQPPIVVEFDDAGARRIDG